MGMLEVTVNSLYKWIFDFPSQKRKALEFLSGISSKISRLISRCMNRQLKGKEVQFLNYIFLQAARRVILLGVLKGV